MEKVNLAEKFARIDAYWTPHIVADVDTMQVKLARIKGEFVWHHHETEDELFFIVKGRLLIQV
ncbi:MAG: cupin domain-containing protein, partial [Anaerolineae bacterium]|nr:cupin domain-containing protein [Anaerolineae bacterium]